MHPVRYALIVSALLAAGAFYPHHSYNYFVLLKWVLFATSIWAAVIESQRKRTWFVIVFAIVAIIHNPIMKFHFDRNVWLVIDGLTGIFFVFASKIIKHRYIVTTIVVIVSSYAIKLYVEETRRKQDVAAKAAFVRNQNLSDMRVLAGQGNPEDQYKLACLIDGDESLEWFMKSARQGHVSSRLRLIWIYLEQGTTEEKLLAVKWLEELSDRNNSNAQHQLSSLYRAGKIVGKDDKKAFDLLRLSVENGVRNQSSTFSNSGINMYSQEDLGEFYEKGIGTEKNLALAYMWYSASITGILAPAESNKSHGYQGRSAREKLESLKKSMTELELEDGKRLYGEWFETKGPFALPRISLDIP